MKPHKWRPKRHLRVGFDSRLKLRFGGCDEALIDSSLGANKQHPLTTLRENLVKTGAKVVRHAKYVVFQLAKMASVAGSATWRIPFELAIEN